MPPKRSAVATPAARRGNQQSFIKTVIDAATSPDNRTVITAVGLFAAGVAFLQSGWGELLLPTTV